MTATSLSLRVALAGNPNAGKSTLFNALTGARQHVGNWPGKTVEKKTGTLARDGMRLDITDLPGAYSLSAYTLEEIVARDFLLEERPDVVVAVVDAANLERNLYLIVQLLELERPGVVALNMMDVAAGRGLTFDLPELSRALAVSVVPTTARKDEGLERVVEAAVRAASGPAPAFRLDYGPEIEAEIAHLLAAIERCPTVAASPLAQSPRWLALKLLEGDADVAARLAVPLPEGEGALGGSMAQNLSPTLSQGERELAAVVAQSRARLAAALGEDVDTLIADRRYAWIHALVGRAVRSEGGERPTLSDRLDRYVTHRRLGIPIFLLAMWLVFKITTDLSAPWVDWLDGILTGPLARWMAAVLAALGLGRSWVESLIIDGVLAGVGGVLAFIPVLLSLYFALAVLEDSGYMARGAFVMDRLMGRIGLHGRSFLPLMVGFGCSVPAIYATRTLTGQRDRILTGLLVPFMSCGARLPVYILFAAVFFPGAASLVILGLYLLGIFVAIAVGLALQRTLLPRTATPGLVMELPPYRLPNARSIWFHMWQRTRAFLQHAASLILLTTMGIWLLTAIPFPVPVARDSDLAASFANTPIEHSAFGRLSAAISPALRPLGFGSWQAGGALLSGLVAKEVVVSTMAQIYGAEAGATEAAAPSLVADLREIVVSLVQTVGNTLQAIPGLVGIDLTREEDAATPGLAAAVRAGFDESSGGHAAAAGLAFMVFVLLYTPCMAAIAAERHELGAKWAVLSLLGQLVIAWVAAFVVFRAGAWLGGG
jgi:ferrous iron transport protein B